MEELPNNEIHGSPLPFGSNHVRVSTEVQVDGNGMKATDYLKPTQVGDVGAARESVPEAVRRDREERDAPSPKVRSGAVLTDLGQPFGMYRHPKEFTEQEDVVIANGLLAHLPLYLIAAKVHCSRTKLSDHINESPLLREVLKDREESLLDHVEFQAKRLVDAGNPAIIMYWLDHKGKSRGWGEQEKTVVEDDSNRIVIGLIPEDEVEQAEKEISENGRELGVMIDDSGTMVGTVGKDGTGMRVKTLTDVPSPQEYARMEQELQRRQDERDAALAGGPKVIDPDGSIEADVVEFDSEGYDDGDADVGPAPWDDGSDDGFGF